MWKVFIMLVCFNSETDKIEFKDYQLEENREYIFVLQNAIINMKKDNIKIIKSYKDSVYVPDDSCYTDFKNKNGYLNRLKK